MYLILTEQYRHTINDTEITSSTSYAIEYFKDRCDEIEKEGSKEYSVSLYDIDDRYLVYLLLGEVGMCYVEEFLYKEFYYDKDNKEWVKKTYNM